jgi:hypothetical protein
VPHLRFNFCSSNFAYADGTAGDRAITVGSLLTAILTDPDGVLPATHVLASFATPSLTGVEKSEFVSARDPTLDATAANEEGLSLYGVDTGIPCAANPNICDSSLGLMCVTQTCIAYPVVQKDQTIVLRGYNFWDVAEARVVFEPLVAGQGSESTAVISTLDANEPTDQAAACTIPGSANPSFNRAHFRVPANEGHFYRLRYFNHNGQFMTQADGAEDGASRVIHTCFPTSTVQDNVPPGTVRDCTPPVETCVQDGAPCAATWTTTPRKLEDCRHLPGQPAPCGETPEWYEAQLLTPRSEGPGFDQKAIVFVEGEAPVFRLTGTLHALETVEETGIDFPGSDEPMMAIVGADLGGQTIPDLDDLATAFHGENYDEGDRKIEDALLTSVEVPVDGSATFLAILFEDDGFFGAFLAGLAAIAVATAIIILSGGAALAAALGGASGVTLVWALLVKEVHQEDDLIGMESFSASPLDVTQRIGATHAPDFLVVSPPLFGPLPELTGGAREDAREGRLIHPFAEFSRSDSPLQPQCNPGSCDANEQCLVNQCVSASFVDPIQSTGFRERREFVGSGGYYGIDLEWKLEKQ